MTDDDLFLYVKRQAMRNQHHDLREWVRGSVVNWCCQYVRKIDLLPPSQMVPFVYEGRPRSRETESQSEPEVSTVKPIVADTLLTNIPL